MKPLTLITLFLIVGSLSEAANFAESLNPNCSIIMNGAIELGDDLKLEAHLEKVTFRDYHSRAVCLNSPGGNYDEGLRMARRFFEKGIGTVVLNGSQCYSTCAVVFMFGTVRSVDSERIRFRRVEVGGAVGFHAPFVSEDSDRNRPEVFRDGVSSIRKFLEVIYKRSEGTFIARESLDRIFPADLVIKMLLMEPRELFLLKSVNDFGRWDVQLITPPLHLLKGSEESRRRAMVQACVNAESWWLFKQDSRALSEHVNRELLLDKRPAETIRFKNSISKDFDKFGDPLEENPVHCIITEYLRPTGNIMNLYMDERFNRRQYFANEPNSDDPQLSDWTWLALDPKTVICDETCQTVRPFAEVK